MEVHIYLWVENTTAFIRNLIRFFKEILPDTKLEYEEDYDAWFEELDRFIYFRGKIMSLGIHDEVDISYVYEEYGTDVNIWLHFDDIPASTYKEDSVFIEEMVNWIMRTSDTDVAIQCEGGGLIFKRMKGEIYYAKESEFLPGDYIPVKHLDFDREKAFEFTENDEWVFCSEEHIQKLEQWRKKQEMDSK